MRSKQLKLNLNKGSRGGRREGAGRKRIHSKGVAHRTREAVNSRNPLHINFKFKTLIKNKHNLKLLKRAVMRARQHGLKIIHFSMQTNHMHFIVEANSNESLTRGMRSLTISFAKSLKKGRVQIERYHLHVLRSVREAKNAILYVLFNQQKHEKGRYSKIDEFSSVLMVKNALDLIRKFAQTKKMTLKINRGDEWDLDKGKSYFYKAGLIQLV